MSKLQQGAHSEDQTMLSVTTTSCARIPCSASAEVFSLVALPALMLGSKFFRRVVEDGDAALAQKLHVRALRITSHLSVLVKRDLRLPQRVSCSEETAPRQGRDHKGDRREACSLGKRRKRAPDQDAMEVVTHLFRLLHGMALQRCHGIHAAAEPPSAPGGRGPCASM